VQVFVDMDGVLADFDRHHEAGFGTRPCRIADNVDWQAVRGIKDFNLNIPPMTDLEALWARIRHHNPIVLTGIPTVGSRCRRQQAGLGSKAPERTRPGDLLPSQREVQ
jgi:hypothetical protein